MCCLLSVPQSADLLFPEFEVGVQTSASRGLSGVGSKIDQESPQGISSMSDTNGIEEQIIMKRTRRQDSFLNSRTGNYFCVAGLYHLSLTLLLRTILDAIPYPRLPGPSSLLSIKPNGPVWSSSNSLRVNKSENGMGHDPPRRTAPASPFYSELVPHSYPVS